MVAAAHLLEVPVTAWHSAVYNPADIPVHKNIALLPVQFFHVHSPDAPFSNALMQLKVWFFAGHDIANAVLAAGVAGETVGLPSPVLTPLPTVVVATVVVLVVVEDVVPVVDTDVEEVAVVEVEVIEVVVVEGVPLIE